MRRESLSALGCVSLCTLCCHIPKGHVADGQQICINLAVYISSVGPASNIHHGNDQLKWLECWELIHSQQHLHQSFGFWCRQVEKIALTEDKEHRVTLLLGKDCKVLKLMCCCGFCVEVSVPDTLPLNHMGTKLHMETSTAPALLVFPWEDCDGVVCS